MSSSEDRQTQEDMRRGCGRTTAQLFDLLVRYREAPLKDYTYVAVNTPHADELRRKFFAALGPCSGPGRVSFVSSSDARFDTERLAWRDSVGMPKPNAALVIDHEVIRRASETLYRVSAEALARADSLASWRPTYE